MAQQTRSRFLATINRWLIVDGGVKAIGGQDRANLELVRYLSTSGQEVHVVAHEVDPLVFELPFVTVHLVSRPFESTFLGEGRLEATANSLRATLGPGTLTVSNGGNCAGDVVWVHSLHAAWPVRDEGAPFHYKIFNRYKKWEARRREAAALAKAQLVVANSQKTKQDLISKAGLPDGLIEVVYFGSDPITSPTAARSQASQIVFIGALGWDRNKGLDIALRAFALMAAQSAFVHSLAVAGAGSSAPWKRMAQDLGLRDRIHFLGLVSDIPSLLRKSDILVSPSRYEAYGLAVHEALAAGVPAIVSADAGVAERLPSEFEALLVRDKESPKAWARAATDVLSRLDFFRARLDVFRQSLVARTWADMGRDFAETVQRRLVRRSTGTPTG